ncbi:MAG: hypothetical protein AB7F88_16735 [Pyrinomonadaceae bacterium]
MLEECNQTPRSGLKPPLTFTMATFKDPTTCFAPLEVVERLLEIRGELGFSENIYMVRTDELTGLLDAFGFDIYAFSTENRKINYGDYSAPVVPGGDTMHTSSKAH